MTKQKTISAADIIMLYKKHPKLWRERSFDWLPSRQEKNLLEFLLDDELLCDEKGYITYFIYEFEPAIAVCLEELAKVLPELFSQFKSAIKKIKAEVQKMEKAMGQGFNGDIESDIQYYVKNTFKQTAQSFEEQKIIISPFADCRQIRKKILLIGLLNSGEIDRLGREIQKLFEFDCRELGIDHQNGYKFELFKEKKNA